MTRWWILILALVLPVACQQQGEQTGTTEETVDTATVEQTIRDAATQFSQAMVGGDVATLTSFYADDAIMLPNGAPKTEGIDAIRGEFEKMYATEGGAPTAFSLDPQTIVVSEAGDLAYEIGSFTWTGVGPDGTEMSDTGKYLAIWKPTETGEWKIAVDTYNTDTMMGAESATATATTETP